MQDHDTAANSNSAAASVTKVTQTSAKPHKPTKKRSNGIELFDREPWPEPVDGAELLNAIRNAIRRHLALPKGAGEAMALWVLVAHTHDTHRTSPRLAFISPVPECGKTTALSILENLVPRPLPTSNITPAVIFRVIEAHRPTLLIDEADTFLHGNDGMKGILNSGHTHATATVWRCSVDDYEPRRFSTWAPIAIAKIGKLSDTLESRSVVIQMRRRRPEESVAPLRLEDSEAQKLLARKAARWGMDHAVALGQAEPEVPGSLYNRARDNWRPLLAIADVAGGHWPETARLVAVELSGCAEDPSIGVMLLADIRGVFEVKDVDRISSAALCTELGKMEDRPWCDYSDGYEIKARQLAKLLKPFGITPHSVRFGDRTPKGYTLADFDDAFARYLPPATATPQQASASAEFANGDPPQKPQQSDGVAQHVAEGDAVEMAEHRQCCAVADGQ